MGAPVRFRVKGTSHYVQPVAHGGYQAGSVGPRLRNWSPASSGPNQVLDSSIDMLRTRSRDAVRQIGYAEAGVEGLVTNIVGAGIKPQFQTADADLNRRLAELFLEWTDEADAEDRLDFYGLQALAVRSMIEGGDSFSRMRVRRPEDGLSVPLQIQMVEAEYCPSDRNTRPEFAANTVRCGVEFTPIGGRAGYHLFSAHPNDQPMMQVLSGTDTVFVPASEVAHLALVRRPGAVRGEPWLTRALVKLHDLDTYDDAQLVRQKIAALFTGFVTDDGTDLDNEVALLGGEVDATAGIETVSLEPGTVQELPSGKKIEWSDPPEPGNSYEAFIRQQMRAVAVSLGLLYEQVTGDYSSINDRTFRAAVNEFRRRCAMWQHHLVVYQWCRPIMRRWTELAVLSGAVRLPAGITVGMVARPKWVPEGWAYINPVQDVQAKRLEVRSGFRSRSEVVSADGYDVEQVDREQHDDITRADDLGLVHDTDARKVSGAGVTQARPDGSQFPGDDSAAGSN